MTIETLSRPPYAGLSLYAQMCVWVSGSRCTTEHGVAYAERGMALIEGLGQ